MTAVKLLEDKPLGPEHFANARSPRMYDFLLGGHDNYQCDREAAFAVYKIANWIKTAALINRDFALLSVETSLALGVRQFLDLGCGFPNAPNVHEISAKTHPGCPTVYVDRDPAVYAHAQFRLDESPAQTVMHADLLATEQLLTNKAVAAAFDLTKPVAVLLHDTLPWCHEDTATRNAMATLRKWMPAGSTLSITHLTDHWHGAIMPDVVSSYAGHGLRVRPRCREEIEEMFGDFTQQGPGLTATGRWHEQGRYTRHPDTHSAAFAGIAVKQTPPSATGSGRNPSHQP
ncbi:SAM-dependent methyltransferase [Streptomyces sp. NBC_01187]|uniref:SAM-dependent methyltransferase n=1 Tax=Streptomyces sp. NBC_01187 TaxID=2903766 RepID=UPI00386C2D86|nr:SAM-dependent methyltransferase [Streptomyces sp. NBC_01187]